MADNQTTIIIIIIIIITTVGRPWTNYRDHAKENV
jgi:hypothetical protein